MSDKIKAVYIMPKEGRFIAIWIHPETGELWGETLQWDYGRLTVYNEIEGVFEGSGDAGWYRDNVSHFVVGG